MLSPGAPRACPDQKRAAELGLKIGTYPTGMLSPVIAAMRAGLAAFAAGKAEAEGALAPAAFRAALGYDAYEAEAKRFMLPE